MPGLGVHHHHFHPPCSDKANKMSDFVELADVAHSAVGHYPNCTQSRAKNDDEVPPHVGHGPHMNVANNRRDSDSTDVLYLSPEAYRATEAIEFIAEHLRCEDEYIQVLDLTQGATICSPSNLMGKLYAILIYTTRVRLSLRLD